MERRYENHCKHCHAGYHMSWALIDDTDAPGVTLARATAKLVAPQALKPLLDEMDRKVLHIMRD